MASVNNPNSKEEEAITLPPLQLDKQLDAGALFVLKSKGSWLHCGYHLTTAIVGPALLSLPFALSSLGWVTGVSFLISTTVVTFYTYNIISLVLEHHAHLGRRHLRFSDMAHDILGPRWARYYVGPIQFGICYGAVVVSTLLCGQSMKFIYFLTNSNGSKMKLYEFVAISGSLMLVLAQIPSFHNLRHINFVSLLLCLAYGACITYSSIKAGNSMPKDYSPTYNGVERMFGIFNSISIIATTFGNGIIPEIQATIAPPVTGKMLKGLCVCYVVLITSFFSVAISGYWAFGNHAAGTLLSNFMVDGKPVIANWFLLITNLFLLLQSSAIGVVYMQPTNELLERKFADPKSEQFSARNIVPRLVFRSLSAIVATTIAAMLPFFGDILAVVGAFGIIPLDFVLPAVFYNITFRPSKWGLLFWCNAIIIVVFSALSAIGSFSAVRQIIVDAKNYHLFANV